MDFGLSEDLLELKELTHQFAKNEIRPVAAEYDEKNEFPHEVMQKAIEIIDHAETELYIRLFPPCGKRLAPYINKAAARGVGIRYVCMGPMPHKFEIQIEHPNSQELIQKIGGESVDIIADKSEALVGMFELGKEDHSPFIWTKNKWFVVGNRDSLRHDFYHFFLNKTYDCNEILTAEEKQIYEFIKADE